MEQFEEMKEGRNDVIILIYVIFLKFIIFFTKFLFFLKPVTLHLLEMQSCILEPAKGKINAS